MCGRAMVICRCLRLRVSAALVERGVGASVEILDRAAYEPVFSGHAHSIQPTGSIRKICRTRPRPRAGERPAHAEFKLGLLGLPSDLPKSEIASAFVPELVNRWGGIDVDAVAERIVQGKAVFLRDA